MIVHKDSAINELKRQDAAQIFLGIGASELVPFDQSEKQIRAKFYQAIADLSLASVRAHWAKQVFTGRGRPPKVVDDNQSQQLFEQHAEAITYIHAKHNITGTKVILRLNTGGK